MMYDLTRAQTPSEAGRYHACIIGSGAAGVTLARKLAAAGKRVALCEGGEMEFSDASQDLYLGDVVGDPYFDLSTTRMRYFGGSTNHWAGRCRPLDRIDFGREDYGPEYVWLIGYADLARHQIEAAEILEVDPDFEDEIVDEARRMRRIRFRRSPPVNFGWKYEDEIRASEAIDLYVGANFVDLDGPAETADTVIVANYDGQRFSIPADTIVFATGGIENSRLLLWLRERHAGRFFDATTPVGHYWMEHPHYLLGEAILETEITSTLNFSLTEEEQRARGLLNCDFQFDVMTGRGRRQTIERLMCVAPRLGARLMAMADRDLVCGVRIRGIWEQAPDHENRVALSATRRDRFDMPLVELHWRKTERDRETIERSIAAFNDWLLDTDRGRLRLSAWMRNGEDYPETAGLAGHHHMGGTRMGTRRDLSVVDADCRVHGASNIYMAGSSNFTTAGHANPTFTIVELSLRLAEHLASRT
jgi:choline dehydrogenase-like flavoprotein